MPYPQGTASRNKLFQSATAQPLPWPAALYFLVLLGSAFHTVSTQAAEAVPLSTDEAEFIALADEPGLLALTESAAAVMEQLHKIHYSYSSRKRLRINKVNFED